MIPVLVINLERDSARRAALASRLDALNIPHTFLKAVDGGTLSAADIQRISPGKWLNTRPLFANEVACGLSHLAAIAEGMRGKSDFFCVLEDDVVPEPKLPLWLSEETLSGLPAFDVLRLFTELDRWDKPSRIISQIGGTIVVRMLRPGWGCQGQIYSRCGGEKVLAAMKTIRAPIDYSLYHDCHVSGLKVLELRPGLVERDDVESSIGVREEPVKSEEPPARLGRNLLRAQRKLLAMVSFLRAWGVRELFSFLTLWR